MPVPSTGGRRCGVPRGAGNVQHAPWVTSFCALLRTSSGYGTGLAVQRDGTVSLRSHPLLLFKGWPRLPPVAPDILCATGFWPLQRAGGCLCGFSFCLCLTCKTELSLESCHQTAENDSLADCECSLRQPSASLLNHHRSCSFIMISTRPPSGGEEQGYPQQTGGTQRVCIQNKILPRPVQKAVYTFCLGTEYSWPRSCLYHEVLEGKAQWKTTCRITKVYFGEIFLSTEQTLQVTNIFNGVYYFIIASCYKRQLKHDKQKKQKCDVLEDQISLPYICFVNLHSSTFCFLWWAVIKAWNSCLPTLPSHVNFALGMSLFQTAFLIMVR